MNRTVNNSVRRNSLIFGGLMVATQIAVCLVYGNLAVVNISNNINISSVLVTIALNILVIAGFGLLFSYLRKLYWSGLGFTFFITALCIEIYPLINAFWTKTRIQKTSVNNTFSTMQFTINLTSFDSDISNNYGNCITNAVKCALAISVAFSSILGRAGPLECFLLTGVGAIGFELNRQVILNLAPDSFGTFFIFTYGGFLGLASSLVMRFRESRIEGASTQFHNCNTASNFSSSLATFGTMIIFTLFPILAYEIDGQIISNVFNYTNAPLSIILGMGAGFLGSYCVSSFINYKVIVRDITNGPVAGAIVTGAAAFYITNPVYAVVSGFVGGVVQAIIQNTFQKIATQRYGVYSTISWSLFGIQGLIGGVFATGYRNILKSNSNGFSYAASSINYNPGYELLIGVISAGIGLGFGLISGVLIYVVNRHTSTDHFMDRTYWMNDDGLNNIRRRRDQEPAKIANSDPFVADSESSFEYDLDFSEGEAQCNNHAYL